MTKDEKKSVQNGLRQELPPRRLQQQPQSELKLTRQRGSYNVIKTLGLFLLGLSVTSFLTLALILISLPGCATQSAPVTIKAPEKLRQVPPLLPEPPTGTKLTTGSPTSLDTTGPAASK